MLYTLYMNDSIHLYLFKHSMGFFKIYRQYFVFFWIFHLSFLLLIALKMNDSVY